MVIQIYIIIHRVYKYFEKDKSIHYSYIYELKFNKSVLKITCLKNFIDFINKYKYPKS